MFTRRQAITEFYQGLTIKLVKKISGEWVIFLDGEMDANFPTKRAARHYIETCIKSKELEI